MSRASWGWHICEVGAYSGHDAAAPCRCGHPRADHWLGGGDCGECETCECWSPPVSAGEVSA